MLQTVLHKSSTPSRLHSENVVCNSNYENEGELTLRPSDRKVNFETLLAFPESKDSPESNRLGT